MQVPWCAFHKHMDCGWRLAAPRRSGGFANGANGYGKIVLLYRGCTQPLDGIAPLGDRLRCVSDGRVQRTLNLARLESIGNRFKLQQQPLKTLKQCVMQVTSNPGALGYALF